MPAHPRGATSMGAHFFFELHKKRVQNLCKFPKKVTILLQTLDRGGDNVYNDINADADAQQDTQKHCR